MKHLIATLAIVALSVLAFGQSKQNKQYGTSTASDLVVRDSTYLRFMTFKQPESNIIFQGGENEPVLIFKSNGDIIYKGRKLVTDTAIVNGLRKVFSGERSVK